MKNLIVCHSYIFCTETKRVRITQMELHNELKRTIYLPVRCTFPSSLNFLRMQMGIKRNRTKSANSRISQTPQDRTKNVIQIECESWRKIDHNRTTYAQCFERIGKTTNWVTAVVVFWGSIDRALDRSGSNYTTNRCARVLFVGNSAQPEIHADYVLSLYTLCGTTAVVL